MPNNIPNIHKKSRQSRWVRNMKKRGLKISWHCPFVVFPFSTEIHLQLVTKGPLPPCQYFPFKSPILSSICFKIIKCSLLHSTGIIKSLNAVVDNFKNMQVTCGQLRVFCTQSTPVRNVHCELSSPLHDGNLLCQVTENFEEQINEQN